MLTTSWLLIGCGALRAPDPVDDTDAPGVDTIEARPPRDEGDTAWPPFDTGRLDDPGTTLDANIGTTALDGVWAGTFSISETMPFIARDPACIGEVSFVIDGTATRHVQATFTCTNWDPNATLLGFDVGYGDLFGVGFATLDPANLDRFRMDISLGAPRMLPADFLGGLVRVVDDTLTMHIDTVVGIGGLSTGHIVDATLTRAVLP